MTEQHPNADASHWRFSFLQDLRETGNVSAAARHVGKSRAALYRARKQDAAFAAEWDDALEEAADWLELEALRRAVDGTEEGRYFQGEMIGAITRYSDSLLMFLLKARRPQLYGGLRQSIPEDGETDIERLRGELETKMTRLVDGDKFKSTQVGAAYTVAPGLIVGVAHKKFEAEDADSLNSEGTETRLQVRVNF